MTEFETRAGANTQIAAADTVEESHAAAAVNLARPAQTPLPLLSYTGPAVKLKVCFRQTAAYSLHRAYTRQPKASHSLPCPPISTLETCAVQPGKLHTRRSVLAITRGPAGWFGAVSIHSCKRVGSTFEVSPISFGNSAQPCPSLACSLLAPKISLSLATAVSVALDDTSVASFAAVDGRCQHV